MAKSEKKDKEIKLRALAKNSSVIKIENPEELDSMISKVSESGRKLLSIEIERDKKIAKTKEEFEKKMAPLKSIANTYFESIVRFANNNRSSLLTGNRKSVDFTNGIIGWKTNPPSVKIVVDEKIAIAFMTEQKLSRFIKTKKYIDIEELGKHPEICKTLPILEYEEGAEYFFTKPNGVQISFMRRMKAASETTKDK